MHLLSVSLLTLITAFGSLIISLFDCIKWTYLIRCLLSLLILHCTLDILLTFFDNRARFNSSLRAHNLSEIAPVHGQVSQRVSRRQDARTAVKASQFEPNDRKTDPEYCKSAKVRCKSFQGPHVPWDVPARFRPYFWSHCTQKNVI